MNNISGYIEISNRSVIDAIDAYQFAMEQVRIDKDLQQEFVEWFFSGNYIPIIDEILNN